MKNKNTNTLIAVGGSGESAVIAYLRMAILIAIPAKELPNILVFDADIADKKDNKDDHHSLYSEIEILFEELTKGVSDDDKPTLKQMFPYYANTDINEKTTFLKYIGGNGTPNTELLDCLFSKEEQNLLLSKGFMATPNVGAITFFDKTQRMQGTKNTDKESQVIKGNDKQLLALQAEIAAGANHPVIVVIGSSFGGTGSGVAPSLAQKLAEIVQTNQQNNAVRLGLFMTLPWFAPTNQKDPNAKETHGKIETQKANAAGGLRYYANSQTLQNSVDLFIADYDGITDIREDNSNEKQPEYPHVFNLLLAAQIQNYFLHPLPQPDNQQGSQTYTCYDFKPKTSAHLKFNGGDSSLLGFSTFDNYRQDIDDWAYETQSVRLAFKEFAVFLKNDFKPEEGKGTRRNPEKFPVLFFLVKKMAQHEVQLKDEKIAFNAIAVALKEREGELQRSIEWLSKVLSKSAPDFSLKPDSITNNLDDRIYRRYPALYQEINPTWGRPTFPPTSERAAIHLFETATNCQTNEIIAAFERRVTTGQSLREAAVAELENCLRKKIRELIPATKRLHDNSKAEGRADCLSRPLIPMQTEANFTIAPYNRIFFNLTNLIDDGNNRDGIRVTKLDDNHPASISILKPSNIPSPWGAALLEDWQQTAAYEAYEHQKPQAELPAQFRFEQIINRVEAILWGIFSKRLTVKQVDDNSILTKAVVSVRDLELKLDKNHPPEPRIFVAIHAETNKLIATNYPTVGWFNVPEVSENWWQSEANFELPSSIINTEKDQTAYALKQVKAFVDWVKEIKGLQDDNTLKPTWYKTLTELLHRFDNPLDNITAAAINTKSSDTKSIDCCFIVAIFDDEGKYHLQSVPYRTLGQSFGDIVADYCVKEVLALQDNDGKFQITDNPLKNEYFKANIKIIGEPKIIGTTEDNKYLNVKYQFDIPQIGRVDIVLKAEIKVRFGSRTSIWPKFKTNTQTNNWQFYYLGSNDSPTTRNGAYTFKVWGIKTDGKPDWLLSEYEYLIFAKNYELHGVPKYLVLFEKHDDEMIEKGAINIGLVDAPVGGTPFRLALDFGTSHSCVYATDNNNNDIGNFFSLSKPYSSDLLKDIIAPKTPEDIYEQFYFLGCLAAKSARDDGNVVPSELKLHGGQEHKVNAPSNIATGIHHLAILPMNFANNDAEMDVKSKSTLGGFKWGMKGVVIPAFQNSNKIGELTKLFNKGLLRQALAILRFQGYDQLTTFRATYPESFNGTQIRIYATALTTALKEVQKETGFSLATPIPVTGLRDLKGGRQVTQDDHGLISESIAALTKVAAQNLNSYAVTLVLDMGGGSTDVAAYVSPSYFRRKNLGIELPSNLTDSIVYAGHDILEILATREIVELADKTNFDLLETELQNPKYSEGEKQQLRTEGWMRILKVVMRNLEDVQHLQQALAHDPQLGAKMRARVKSFYDGIFEYVRQLILAYDAKLQPLILAYNAEQKKGAEFGKWDLSILLLGNGWRLADFIFPIDGECGACNGIKGYLKPLSAGISLSISFPNDPNCSVKQAIAKGALLYPPPNFIANQSLCGFSGLNMSDGQHGLIDPLERTDNIMQVSDLNALPTGFIQVIGNVEDAKDTINDKIISEFDAYINDPQILGGTFAVSPMRHFLELVWKPAVKKI